MWVPFLQKAIADQKIAQPKDHREALESWVKSRYENLISSAVAVVFSGQSFHDAQILLTLRSSQVATHAGQVAYPGGMKDQDDESLLHTAIRETYEEVGLLLDEKHCLGSGDVFLTLGGGFQVTPFVFHVPEVPLLSKSAEVDLAEWVSVKSLVQTEKKVEYEREGLRFELSEYVWRPSTTLHSSEHRFWGLSAAIFRSFEFSDTLNP